MSDASTNGSRGLFERIGHFGWLWVFLIGQVVTGIVWATRIDGEVKAIRVEIVDHNRRFMELDNAGSRGVVLLAQRTAAIERQFDRLEQMIEARGRQIADTAAAVQNLQLQEARETPKVQGQIDTINAVLRRLEEQQTRIIQALDATYNLLNEHMRSTAHLRQQPFQAPPFPPPP